MKKIALILLLVISAASCAVKDKNAPGADPDYNRFFYIAPADYQTSSTSIWVNDFRFDAPGAVVSQYGLCCAISRKPYITDKVASYYGSAASGPVVLEGLSPNTTYQCRAFIVTVDGSAYYSEIVSLATTSPISLALDGFPTSNTEAGGYVKAVVTGGNIADSTEKGFCYGTSETPTVNDNKLPVAGSSNTITGYIPMSPGQMFYYRAYARMSDGTVVYSEDSYYIQTYAVTEGYSIYNMAYGNFERNGEYYGFKADIKVNMSYYSTSQLSKIGFRVGGNSWYFNDKSDGKFYSEDTWYFKTIQQTITYQAYATLNSGKTVWGEEKTAYFYY